MNNERNDLLQSLSRIKDNDFNLNEGESADFYLDLMMKYIGDPDSELRDKLIYDTFSVWLIDKPLTGKIYVTNTKLISLLNTALDEKHLFCDIGSEMTDSVFTRSFSLLLLVLIINIHQEGDPVFEHDVFTEVKDKILKYFSLEKDYRGYVELKGWAHAAAHGADLLDELVQCRECNQDIHLEILTAIKTMIQNDRYFFCHEEDERIVNVIMQILAKHILSLKQVIAWIEELWPDKFNKRLRSQYVRHVNTKNLIRSLYFRIISEPEYKDLSDVLLKLNNTFR